MGTVKVGNLLLGLLGVASNAFEESPNNVGGLENYAVYSAEGSWRRRRRGGLSYIGGGHSGFSIDKGCVRIARPNRSISVPFILGSRGGPRRHLTLLQLSHDGSD